MASLKNIDFTGADAEKAMLKGLVNTIRENLKEIIMEDMDQYVDKAIDGALETFNVNLRSMIDLGQQNLVVKLLVDRKDKSNG